MVGGLLMKSPELMLRRELFNLSPSLASPKSLYLPSARVCFRRTNNINNILSSSGANKRLVLAVAPHHNLDNVILSCSNKTNPFIVNDHRSVITVSNKIDEIKNKVFRLFASLLLFGFLAFMTSPTRNLKGVSALAITTSSSTSTLPSSVSTSCTKCNCGTHTICSCDCHLGAIFGYSLLLMSFSSFVAVFLCLGISLVWLVASFTILIVLLKILFIGFAIWIMVPPVVALVSGFFYFLQLCKDDIKSVLVLQVGVLDKMRELQTELAQTADTANLDCAKLEGVMKSLLQRYDSCHFAYLSVTQCISDEDTKYGVENDKMDSICSDDPYYEMIDCIIKKLVINYDGKYSKQLFREVLTGELVKYDRDNETFANVDDGMKYEKKAVGEEHGMVDNNYLVVTLLVLTSGMYSFPPLVCNPEHVKTVLQEFNTIPKSKVESVEVLWTPQMEDEVVSKQELQRDFPQLKPVNFTGFDDLAVIS
ncbi:hypothetical protein POM88_013935 [Heracleum sosnowskyi]|uniref:Uncharacterized protein n=1 Tax=Heracleum sosnowskyi TaxID=360622 RepID=A0AAD8N373_9APIA|nr:hypothetical protein POM88_013935 [Heracleum sosnowskyi]